MPDNVTTARAIFDAFGRGDVPYILEQLADDVQWEYGICATTVAWYQHRQGHAGAVAFFESLQGVDFLSFVPKAFLHDAAQDAVAVLVDSDYLVRASGKRVSYVDAVLLLRFDAEGRVSHFAHRVDLLQAERALS